MREILRAAVFRCNIPLEQTESMVSCASLRDFAAFALSPDAMVARAFFVMVATACFALTFLAWRLTSCFDAFTGDLCFLKITPPLN